MKRGGMSSNRGTKKKSSSLMSETCFMIQKIAIDLLRRKRVRASGDGNDNRLIV